MSTITTNYNLIKYSLSDAVSQNIGTDEPNNMDTIDTELFKAESHRESTGAHNSEYITYAGDVSGTTNVRDALNDLQNQVDSITVGAGTSPAEVVAARDGVRGETNATLNTRLDKMEGMIGNTTVISSNTVLTDDYRGVILVDTSSGNVTLTLPPISSTAVQVFTIKKQKGSFPVGIFRDSAPNTIDGEISVIMDDLYDTFTIVGDGVSEWCVTKEANWTNKVNVMKYATDTIYDGIVSADSNISDALITNFLTGSTPISGTLYFPNIGAGTYKLTSNLNLSNYNGLALEFESGAKFSMNTASVVGSNTRIIADIKTIFDGTGSRTPASGTWDIDCAYPEWFGASGNGTDDDTLKIQQALNMHNRVKFMPKTYLIDVLNYDTGEEDCLIVNDNQILIGNNATIYMITNDYGSYKMFLFKNIDNVYMEDFTLIGDVDRHTGVSGEFGYGLTFKGATNCTIKRVTSEKMWGDGIDLDASAAAQANVCQNIILDQVHCDQNRRQGMSVEGVDGLFVYNSKFTRTGNILATAPTYGIDLEVYRANVKNTNIYFDNIECSGSTGQFLNITPIDGFKAVKCRFIGADTTTAVFWNNLGADEYDDIHKFVDCEFVGGNLLYNASEYVDCEFKNTGITLEGFLVEATQDQKITFKGCRFYATDLTKFINCVGSTTDGTRKNLYNCDFYYDGDGSGFGGYRNLTTLANYFTFDKCNFYHTGATPVYTLTAGAAASTINGTDGRMYNCWMDPTYYYAPHELQEFLREYNDKVHTYYDHDMTLASGSFSITGLGFKPRTVNIVAGVNGTAAMSFGMASKDTAGTGINQGSFHDLTAFGAAGVYNNNNTEVLRVYTGAGPDFVTFTVTSFDVDGFTISFVKNGGPTGTCSLKYIASM